MHNNNNNITDRHTYIAHSHFDGGENPKIILGEISQNVHVELHCDFYCTAACWS
jgi:hypothetical protein